MLRQLRTRVDRSSPGRPACGGLSTQKLADNRMTPCPTCGLWSPIGSKQPAIVDGGRSALPGWWERNRHGGSVSASTGIGGGGQCWRRHPRVIVGNAAFRETKLTGIVVRRTRNPQLVPCGGCGRSRESTGGNSSTDSPIRSRMRAHRRGSLRTSRSTR